METFNYLCFKKCKILSSLTPQTPTQRYVDLKVWAAKMACIQHGAIKQLNIIFGIG